MSERSGRQIRVERLASRAGVLPTVVAPFARFASPARPPEQPTVFVVDSDPALREALDELISSAGLRCQTAASAEEFLAARRAMTPACLVVDVSLPGIDGLELQGLLFDRTELPIIFVSRLADVQTSVSAMKAGAFDFIIKPIVNDVLLGAIRQALERSRTELCKRATMRALQYRYESLSRREREVMGLVVSGRLNKQVGGELGISEITVKAHRGKMMRKMRASTLAELVKMALNLRRSAPKDVADLEVPSELAYTHPLARAIGSYAPA